MNTFMRNPYLISYINFHTVKGRCTFASIRYILCGLLPLKCSICDRLGQYHTWLWPHLPITLSCNQVISQNITDLFTLKSKEGENCAKQS